MNKLTCKKLPDFSLDCQSAGILRVFKIQQNPKTQMFELFADSKLMGQWRTIEEAIIMANKFNQSDYEALCVKIMKWEGE